WIASPPSSLISFATLRAAVSLISQTATLAPSLANLVAVAGPMTEPAPVMMDTLSTRRMQRSPSVEFRRSECTVNRPMHYRTVCAAHNLFYVAHDSCSAESEPDKLRWIKWL